MDVDERAAAVEMIDLQKRGDVRGVLLVVVRSGALVNQEPTHRGLKLASIRFSSSARR